MANSTREASSIQEKRIAKKLGGTVTPNSGATLWKKGDVRVEDVGLLIECKTTMKEQKSVSIQKEWLEKNKKELFASGCNNSIIAFNFFYADKKDYYVIDDSLMEFLIEKLREELE